MAALICGPALVIKVPMADGNPLRIFPTAGNRFPNRKDVTVSARPFRAG